MPTGDPKYDVAISFLSRDEATAAAIHRKLSESLQVFFYPRNQEELGGTDGMESMRIPFFDSRLMVILYQEPWGKTPWTRVEETAIKDACLEDGWQRLFFIVLDPLSVLPVWLPKTHVRFNFVDFGLEQAVGAIKARVQENGGQLLPLTAMKRAEIYKADELYRRDKSLMNSLEGTKSIADKVAELFRQIEARCAEIKAQGHLQIRCGSNFNDGIAIQSCIMTNDYVSLAVIWKQLYQNSLDNSSFIVREFSGGLALPGEQRICFPEPKQLRDIRYLPELSLAREYGWAQHNTTEFLSSGALAERCVIQFVDLASRRSRGEL